MNIFHGVVPTITTCSLPAHIHAYNMGIGFTNIHSASFWQELLYLTAVELSGALLFVIELHGVL